MSDTDDTDLLLIIPPDFFNVRSSDSEDSEFSVIRRDSDISRHIVQDLVNHVNQLESRVCTIESKENLVSNGRSLDCSVAVDSADIKHGDVALSFYSMTSTGYRFGTSLDCNRSALRTSWKQKPQSLPTTPSTHHQRLQLIPDILGHSYTNAIHERENIRSCAGNRIPDDRIKSSTSLADNLSKNDSARTVLSDSSDSYPLFSEPDDQRTMSYQDLSFLSEIDEFLESKRAVSREHEITSDLMANNDLKSKLEKNNINSNKKGSSFIEFDSMNKPASLFHPDVNSIVYDTKRLTLSDVDKLLLEMEKKQSEIEQKLKLGRPSYHSSVPVSYSCDRPSSIFSDSRKQSDDRNRSTVSVPESQSYNGTVNSNGRWKEVNDEMLPAAHDVCTEGKKSLEKGEVETMAVSKKLSVVGDNICSVPDLGYGVRNIMMQPSSSADHETLLTNSADQRGHVTSRNICVKGNEVPKQYATEESSVCASMLRDNIGSVPDSQYGVQNLMMQHSENANHPPTQNVSADERNSIASANTLASHTTLISMSESLNHLPSKNPTNISDASNRTNVTLPVSSEGRLTVQSSNKENEVLCQILDRPYQPPSHGSMRVTSRHFTNILEIDEKNNKNQTECYTEDNRSKLQQPFGIAAPSMNNVGDKIVPNEHQGFHNMTKCGEQVDAGVVKQMDQAVNSGRNSNGDTDTITNRRVREMPNRRMDFSGHTYSGKFMKKKVEFSRESSNTHIKGKSGSWTDGGSNVFQMRRNGHYDNTSTSSGPLLSLSELWGSDSSGHNRKSSNIEQRLEEEVYRRQHCERLVQELQRQLLEEREKLAVAMRVDESKDYAISQLQTAWDKLVGHWNDLEDERNELAQQLQDHKIAAAQEVTELQEKVKSVERELSRALELAQGYQTRCSEMECELVKAKSSTEATVALSEAKMLNLNNEIASITAERDRLLTRVSDVETAITKDRSLLKEAEAEMKKMQDTVTNQEAEIHSLKQQSETLLLRLNEAKSKNQLLENSKTAVQKALEETKKKEKERQSELKEVVEQMKQEKLKLRDSYQQQVETLVHEKVQEFQSQLDAAETALEQREKTLAEMTSQQIKLLTEKYQMEVKLLEEKQQDEMKLYKIQLAQANQQLEKLQAQLQLQTKHRNELLEQLHDAMEAQWQEALRMVQGKGDAWTTSHFNDVDSPSHRKSPSTKDHPVSVPETTAIDKYQFAKMLDTVKNAAAFQEAYHSDIPPLTLPTSSAASTVDDEPFSKEDQLTYRVQENKQHSVSPGEELRKYIQQLLDRSPGNPIQEVTQESAERDIDKEMEHPVSSVPVWEPVGTDQASISSVASTSQLGMISRDVYDTVKGTRNMKSNKPPWK
ncbi:uncharacterized protein LOC126252813 [Schistocerca nitens]|uniref:uncharacterized protein LOC126252813 n=1 Tax=Schistocerca nitens TaxID=7011 RepID=UPI00211953D2|nr:uncharacterized protein LOC126252813 [Schistocerca nitens]XP_049809722.1 uncharacterized protein LOC126252813 [Schistocerca nitens]